MPFASKSNDPFEVEAQAVADSCSYPLTLVTRS